jgi:hypothetical protein
MRTEHLPEVLVSALADQVQVDVPQRRQPTVGIVDLVDRARAIVHPHPVVGHRAVDHRRKHTAVGVFERCLLAVLQQGDVLRVVPQRADHGAAVTQGMSPEDAVRVVRVAADQLLVVVVARAGRRGRRCLLRHRRRVDRGNLGRFLRRQRSLDGPARDRCGRGFRPALGRCPLRGGLGGGSLRSRLDRGSGGVSGRGVGRLRLGCPGAGGGRLVAGLGRGGFAGPGGLGRFRPGFRRRAGGHEIPPVLMRATTACSGMASHNGR